MVYAVARRKVGGDAQLAEDVTQRVFADAARAAARLGRHPAPSGWLFTSTHFAATQIVRAEQRRRAREQEAHAMHEQNTDPAAIAWERLRPALDDLIAGLAERDREAVLLRFYEGQSWAEVGARLQLSEAAARSRVERALERLRAALARQGETATTAALGLALAGQAGAAPAGLAAAVTGTALAGAAASGGAAASAAGGWTFMTMSKLQAGVVAVVAAAGAAAAMHEVQAAAALRREIAGLRPEPAALAAVRDENRRLAAQAAEVEALRRDDAELKRLEQEVAEVRRVTQARARERAIAERAETAARQAALAAEIRAADRRTQAEVERLNREGNALVVRYKELTAQAKEVAWSAEERTKAEAAAQATLAEVKAKQREIKEFLASTQAALAPQMQELRRLSAVLGMEPTGRGAGATPASGAPGPVPPGGRLELRPAANRGFEFKPGGQP
jgi:RNA polymerase sigma factor (sigma-70 family)